MAPSKNSREKAEFKNPDEFSFRMIRAKLVDGVHTPMIKVKKYTAKERMQMKTQHIHYIFLTLQSEKKKIEKLTVSLHCLGHPVGGNHVYFAQDREEAKELESHLSSKKNPGGGSEDNTPKHIKRKIERSCRDLEACKSRAEELEKLYFKMSMQKELQKKAANGNCEKTRL